MEETLAPYPVVSFDRVDVRLGGCLIQKQMSFAIEPGEYVGILGPNGAGKSTLLKLILGILEPSAGKIEIFGQAPRVGNRRIGYTPQFHSLEASLALRSRDIVGFGLDGHRWGPGWPNKLRTQKINQVLDEVGCLNLADASFGELSGGERQRMMIAQALLSDPELLLMDEPLASLDLVHAQEIVALTDKIRRARGTTVLFVTHDVNPLLQVMDKVLYMAGARSALGSVEEVITTEALSALYGSRVDVIRQADRVFVMGVDV